MSFRYVCPICGHEFVTQEVLVKPVSCPNRRNPNFRCSWVWKSIEQVAAEDLEMMRSVYATGLAIAAVATLLLFGIAIALVRH